MTWLRIDDGFIENEKIEHLRDRAFRVHVSGLVYCAKNLTDGQVSAKGVKVLSILLGWQIKRHVPDLIEAGLWSDDQDGDGYWINDYLKYNPDAETIKKKREERRESGKAGAAARWGKTDGSANGSANGNSHSDSQWLPHMPQPSPSPARPREVLKAVPADQEIEHEIDKILRHVKGADDDSRGVLVAIARKLPVGCVAKVRESCQSRSVSVGYAVNALKSELADLEEVA